MDTVARSVPFAKANACLLYIRPPRLCVKAFDVSLGPAFQSAEKRPELATFLTPGELRGATFKKRGQAFLAIFGRIQKPHPLPFCLNSSLEAGVLRDTNQQLAASESHRRQLQPLARPLRRDLQRLA